MRPGYRIAQFWQLIHAPPLSREAWQEIEALLSPPEVNLFRRFGDGDRQHSYRVMRSLRVAGNVEPALLVAALLHDVGKTHIPLSLVERILGTLGEVFFPAKVTVWGSGRTGGWRRPFAIRVQHAEWGAKMAEEAGSWPLAVRLIRHHQDKALEQLDAGLAGHLRQLQWADDQN